MIADERNGDTEPRRAIDYVPGYNRYSDRVEEEAEDEEQNSGRAIEEGNNGLSHVFTSQIGRDQQASVENDWTRT